MPKAKRTWIVAAIGVLTLAPTGASLAQQASPPPASPAPSGMDHGGMSHGMDHSGMGRGGGMGHGGMGHGGMGQGGMGQGGMSREATEGDSHGMAAHGQGKGPMVPMMCRTAEHVDGRLAYLKAELKPTDAQTPQWNAFAEAIRVSGRKVADFCAASKEEHARPAEGEKAASHGLLEQLAHMERNMTIHLESVRAVRSAAEPLAAALTPEQKKIFDETMTGLMGFGMGMGKM